MSTTATQFSGTGNWNDDPTYTWTITGTVSYEHVSFYILYTGTNKGYNLTATGVDRTRRVGVRDRDGQQQADAAVHDAGQARRSRCSGSRLR